jgi:hypothetical protein
MLVTYKFQEGSESLSSHTGLGLAGALLERTELKDRLSNVELLGCKDPVIAHSDIVFSMIGLQCIGKPDYDAIEPFRKTPFFIQSLGIDRCPSSSALRQRLDVVGDAFDGIIKKESARLIRNTAPDIKGVSTSDGVMIPLDVDVSPFDNSKTNKEGASRTYKGHDGFAPIFAYLGRDGYLVNLELREGKQHCQNGTVEFLSESIKYSKSITDEVILVRLDSGNDSLDNIGACVDEDVEWIIKRNIRRESKADWLKIAKEVSQKNNPRDGKTAWRGEIYRNVDGFEKPLRIVLEVTERSIDKKGQFLIVPDIEVDTYWTSLKVSPGEGIWLYHEHGESEQFHSELKSDMDLERLPSGNFKTNALVLLLGMLSYNILRLCGQESLRDDNGNEEDNPSYRGKAGRRRIRTVIQDLIYIASYLTTTGRQWFLSFGKHCAWTKVWRSIYQRFKEPIPGGSPRMIPIRV